jgi:hypothetical protein
LLQSSVPAGVSSVAHGAAKPSPMSANVVMFQLPGSMR